MKSHLLSSKWSAFFPLLLLRHACSTRLPLIFQGPFGQHGAGPGTGQTSGAHLTLWTGAYFSHSEKKERTKKESICQKPLNELLKTAQPRYWWPLRLINLQQNLMSFFHSPCLIFFLQPAKLSFSLGAELLIVWHLQVLLCLRHPPLADPALDGNARSQHPSQLASCFIFHCNVIASGRSSLPPSLLPSCLAELYPISWCCQNGACRAKPAQALSQGSTVWDGDRRDHIDPQDGKADASDKEGLLQTT